MSKIFGTDGIRCLVNEEPISAETCLKISKTVAFLLKKKNSKKKGSLIEACKFIRTAKLLDMIEYSYPGIEASKIITFDTFLNNLHAYDFPLGMFTSEFPINQISNEFKQASGKNFLQLRSSHPQRRDFINFNFNDFLNRDKNVDKFLNDLTRLRG